MQNIEPRHAPPQTESADALAFEVAMHMLAHMSPLGGLLELLRHALDGVEALEGFAAFALGQANINPKDALNPAFAYLVSVPAWRRAQPAIAEELRQRGIRPAGRRPALQPPFRPGWR